MIKRKHGITERALLFGILILFVLNIVTPVLALFPERSTVYEIPHSDSIRDEDIFMRVEFPRPEIQLDEGSGKILISGDEWAYSFQGSYAIPTRHIKVLIPPGTAITDINTNWECGEVISRDIPIATIPSFTYPGGPISSQDKRSENASGKYIDQPYIESTGLQYFRGFAIAQLIAHPITYEPRNHEIRFYSSMEVRIRLGNNAVYNSLPMIRVQASALPDREELALRDLVKTEPSSDVFTTMYSNNAMRSGRSIPQPGEYYPYVIITSGTYYDHFLPLVRWKTNKGIPTKIVNITDITSDPDYNDVDNPAEIRNFIADAYQNWNTEYVLLGGDTDIIPIRGIYVDAGICADDIPSDLYYGCLDGPYNNDGDARWGEENDGAGGGEVDLVAEVYIGRVPVGSTLQVDAVVNKILDYEKNPRAGFAEKALLSAAWLDDITDGAWACDDIETQTFPPQIVSTKLYSTLGNASVVNFNAAMNGGVNIVYNAGHANEQLISIDNSTYFTRANADALSSGNKFSIFYTMGCYANAFDANDAFSEHMMYDDDGGCVVFIGNSRYGLYSQGSYWFTKLYSHKFGRQFFHKVFQEGVREGGKANQLSREDLIGDVHDPSIADASRWVYFTLNYMGDPTLNIWFNEPEPLTVTHSPIMYTDSPAPVNVQVKDSDSQPVTNARVDVVNWPDLFSNGTTDVNGNASVSGTPTVVGLANITVTGDDLKPFYTAITISDDSVPPTTTVNTASYGWYRNDPGAVIDVDFSNGGSGSDLWFAQYREGLTGDWVDIFNGTVVSTFTDEWALDWHSLSNGVLTIYIQCFDRARNIDTATITYSRDYNPPVITTNITEMGWFHANPSLGIDVHFINMGLTTQLDRGYYTVNDGPEIDIFTSPVYYYDTDIIPDWSSLVDGTNWINFSVIDTGAVLDNSHINIIYRKDTVMPSVIINNNSYGYFTSDPGAVIDVDFFYGNVSLMVNASYRGEDGIWHDIFTDTLTEYFTNWSINFSYLYQGENQIDIRVYDEAGNIRLMEDAIIMKIDNLEPEIILNADSFGWYGEDPGPIIDVDFSSGGGSPLVLGQYRVENHDWADVFNTSLDEFTTNWSVDFFLLNEGINEIDLRAFDTVNISKVLYEKVSIMVDFYKPIVMMDKIFYDYSESLQITGGDDAFQTTFSNGDTGSMIQKAQYRVGPSGDWVNIFNMSLANIDYNWVINKTLLDQGKNIIYVRAFDGLYQDDNNTMITFYYDSLPPMVQVNQDEYGWYNSDPGNVIDIDFFENGGGSNISFIRSSIGDSEKWTYHFKENHTLNGTTDRYVLNLSLVFDDLEEGTNVILFEVGDHAGHITETEVDLFKDTVPPSPVVLNSPKNGRETSAKKLHVYWNKVISDLDESDIAFYQCQVAKTGTFTNPLFNESTGELSAEISLSTADSFYWRVRAMDGAGNVGQWSNTWRFSSNSPPKANIYVPDKGYIFHPVTLNASLSTDDDGDIINFTWTIDDSDELYGKVVEYEFDTHGTHTICLLIRDDLGKPSMTEVNIQIERPKYKIGEKIKYNDKIYTITGYYWSDEEQSWKYTTEEGVDAPEPATEPYNKKKGEGENSLWGIPLPYLIAIAVVSLILVIAFIFVIVKSRGYSHIFCPNCAEKVARGRGYCPSCNQALFKNRASFVTSDCPKCGYPVYDWEERCADCNLTLGARSKQKKGRYGHSSDDDDFQRTSYQGRYDRHMERERGRWTRRLNKGKKSTLFTRKGEEKQRKERRGGPIIDKDRKRSPDRASAKKERKGGKAERKREIPKATEWKEESEYEDEWESAEMETSWEDDYGEQYDIEESDWSWDDSRDHREDDYDDEYEDDEYEDDEYYEDGHDGNGYYDEEYDDEKDDLDKFNKSFGSSSRYNDIEDDYYGYGEEDEEEEEEWDW